MTLFYAICTIICLILVCTGWVFGNPGEMTITEAMLGIIVSVMPLLNFGVIVAVLIVAYEMWERKREVATRSVNFVKEN